MQPITHSVSPAICSKRDVYLCVFVCVHCLSDSQILIEPHLCDKFKKKFEVAACPLLRDIMVFALNLSEHTEKDSLSRALHVHKITTSPAKQAVGGSAEASSQWTVREEFGLNVPAVYIQGLIISSRLHVRNHILLACIKPTALWSLTQLHSYKSSQVSWPLSLIVTPVLILREPTSGTDKSQHSQLQMKYVWQGMRWLWFQAKRMWKKHLVKSRASLERAAGVGVSGCQTEEREKTAQVRVIDGQG